MGFGGCVGFPRKVTEEMNKKLTSEVTDAEIRSAVFEIKSSSVPGKNDGISGMVFQNYWNIIRKEISNEVKLVFRREEFRKGM